MLGNIKPIGFINVVICAIVIDRRKSNVGRQVFFAIFVNRCKNQLFRGEVFRGIAHDGINLKYKLGLVDNNL